MPFTISYSAEFPAAHQLKDYDGKCKRLHGHNYRVELSVCRKTLNPQGMVIDFIVLKELLEGVIAPLEHGFLNETVHPVHPTAELTAKRIYAGLERVLRQHDRHCRLLSVAVWENERACAGYYKNASYK